MNLPVEVSSLRRSSGPPKPKHRRREGKRLGGKPHLKLSQPLQETGRAKVQNDRHDRTQDGYGLDDFLRHIAPKELSEWRSKNENKGNCERKVGGEPAAPDVSSWLVSC